MKLVVGLGNPGSQYARTRHNIGWQTVDRLAEMFGLSRRTIFRVLRASGRGRREL